MVAAQSLPETTPRSNTLQPGSEARSAMTMRARRRQAVPESERRVRTPTRRSKSSPMGEALREAEEEAEESLGEVAPEKIRGDGQTRRCPPSPET